MGTLNVNAIADAGGGSNVTMQGEGTATTNLSQGLCKAWVFGGEDASLNDSFNISGGTDNGTGTYTYAFTSDLANINYSGGCSANDNSDRNVTILVSGSGQYAVEVFQQNGSEIDTRNRSLIVGDLA